MKRYCDACRHYCDEANLQTTTTGAGIVEATPMKRYISIIEENGAWRIEGFYKSMPDDDK